LRSAQRTNLRRSSVSGAGGVEQAVQQRVKVPDRQVVAPDGSASANGASCFPQWGSGPAGFARSRNCGSWLRTGHDSFESRHEPGLAVMLVAHLGDGMLPVDFEPGLGVITAEPARSWPAQPGNSGSRPR
jgi:hypothetical protein